MSFYHPQFASIYPIKPVSPTTTLNTLALLASTLTR